MNGLTRIILTACLLITLTACSSISLTGMYKLSQQNPLSIDPAQIKVAIKTDKAIQVKDGAVQIKFGYQSDDNSIDINDKFDVQLAKNSQAKSAIFNDISINEYVAILSLSEKDARKFQENQRIISAHKAQGKEGKGFFTLSLNDFCLPSPLPTRDLNVDIYLQTEIKDGFFTFLSDVDLKEQLSDMSEENLAELEKACQQKIG